MSEPQALPSAADVLVETAAVLAALAAARLAEETRDLDEARHAIDALTVLLPLLPEDARRDVQAALSHLQLAFADVV
ncbi:MAG TPA: hypothetical protein VMJ49_00225 [Gaiellaceae bacterium]|nr:hypothetical protein [Gaiellaceae bacterium]